MGKPGEGSNVDGGVGARGWQNMNKIQNPGYSALIKGFANLKKLKKVWLVLGLVDVGGRGWDGREGQGGCRE